MFSAKLELFHKNCPIFQSIISIKVSIDLVFFSIQDSYLNYQLQSFKLSQLRKLTPAKLDYQVSQSRKLIDLKKGTRKNLHLKVLLFPRCFPK